ncbi:IS200/IS605 family transposase, partial [Escherichia coli]
GKPPEWWEKQKGSRGIRRGQWYRLVFQFPIRELKESNGDVDHVHMLIEYPPTVQLSVLVNSLKAVTSRRLRNEFLDLRGAYGKAVLWSRSYFAGSCGGAPLEVVKQYIQHQRG